MGIRRMGNNGYRICCSKCGSLGPHVSVKEWNGQKELAQKEAREEASANSRMNNVVRGVTNDLTIYDDNRNEGSDIDITEIEAVDNEDDMYSDDIYDPLITPMPRISREPVWELHTDLSLIHI